MSVTVVTGSNSFMLGEYTNRQVEEFRAKYGDFSIEKIDGEEVEEQRIVEAIQNLPFLADRRLVVLRNPSANKYFVDNIESVLSSMPDTTTLLIVESKLDKRSNYYKFLKKQTTIKEFGELDEGQLANWLVDVAKDEDAQLSMADARYLINRVGVNQLQLAQEINKLATYDPAISRQTIDELTVRSPQSTIFDLLEAAFSGNTKRALIMYGEQRQMKVEPQQIVAMFAWQLQILALIKTAKGKTTQEIAKDAKLNPYVVSRSSALARKIPYAVLKAYVDKLYDIDIKSKTTNLNINEALQNFIVELGLTIS